MKLVECVQNFSVGNDNQIIDKIASSIQNTKGVKSIVPIPPDQIYKQIVYTAKDIKPDSIKIGMLHSKA